MYSSTQLSHDQPGNLLVIISYKKQRFLLQIPASL